MGYHPVFRGFFFWVFPSFTPISCRVYIIGQTQDIWARA